MTDTPIWIEPDEKYFEVHEVVVPHVGHVPVAKGEFHDLPKKVQHFIIHWIEICKPRAIYICDGGKEEADMIITKLMERGTLEKLSDKFENCYVCRTDPADVARVESKTFICTKDRYATVPHHDKDTVGILGQWISPENLNAELQDRFPGCMAGRMMYVIPFSMGPIGSPLSKIGVELTDSNYVQLCMRIMTRVSPKVWTVLGDGEFVKCVHSVGCPRPPQWPVRNHWPCNPAKTLITHMPDERVIMSYGSGYGGNSLLGKKCFALRIAGRIAYDEGWLAEHMLIMSVTNPKGEEFFIAAAFPSACGKTNMAMLNPTLPGWKVQCVGDDIAWMRFDSTTGELRAINPEYGFFGVAPGTNMKTNPNALLTCLKNTIFTNVATTSDGGFFWESLEDEIDKNVGITTWLGKPFRIGYPDNAPAAHPNSRFCCPAGQCPIIHPKWEDPAGVPISAIVFGGRRPEGIPVVLEAFDWPHGVMLGAACKSEATAAAEFKGKIIMHDPMAMRPFVGYNFGRYLTHWLSMDKPGRKMPKIFHVNWFRKDERDKFVWPGFGDNIRVIDWICRRVKGEDIAEKSPLGYIPKQGTLNCDGINVQWDKMFDLPYDYLVDDISETRRFLISETGDDLPKEITAELDKQRDRILAMKK
jgi:phosphoenolpyruvate carboxykinase (GTP)